MNGVGGGDGSGYMASLCNVMDAIIIFLRCHIKGNTTEALMAWRH